MNIVIMGLPGCGKGTQSELLVNHYNIKHISTGDMFRNAVKSGSKLGNQVKELIDAGNLVPDELTAKVLSEEISKKEYDNGFLLDGYPRNINQVKTLDEILTSLNKSIDKVLYLNLDEEVIVKRLSGRLVCPTCSATYNTNMFKDGEKQVCKNDNTTLIQREDDKIERINHRLKVANEQTIPVIDLYKTRDLVNEIKILETDLVEKTFDDIKEVLK